MSRHNFNKQFLTFLSFLHPRPSAFLFLILLLSPSWARGWPAGRGRVFTRGLMLSGTRWGGVSVALWGALLSLIPSDTFFPFGIETEQLRHQVNLQQVALLQTTPHPLQASLPWGEGQGDPRGVGESIGLLPASPSLPMLSPLPRSREAGVLCLQIPQFLLKPRGVNGHRVPR